MRKKKILLVYEEYAEMARTQKDLMRLGFDVVGTQSEHQLQKELMEFNPELILILSKGQKLNLNSVADRIRSASVFRGGVFLLVPPGIQMDPQVITKIRLDAILPAAVELPALIRRICDQLRIESQKILEKLEKLQSSQSSSPVSFAGKSAAGSQKEETFVISGRSNFTTKEHVKDYARDHAKDYNSALKKVEEELAREGIKVNPKTTTFSDPKLDRIRREIRAEGRESAGPSGAFGPSGQVQSLDSLAEAGPDSAKGIQQEESYQAESSLKENQAQSSQTQSNQTQSNQKQSNQKQSNQKQSNQKQSNQKQLSQKSSQQAGLNRDSNGLQNPEQAHLANSESGLTSASNSELIPSDATKPEDLRSLKMDFVRALVRKK